MTLFAHSTALNDHQQNVFSSLGASGSDWELLDGNPRAVKPRSLLDRCIGLLVHVGAPGSAGDKPESTDYKSGYILNHSRAVWEKHLLQQWFWCAWKSLLLRIFQQLFNVCIQLVFWCMDLYIFIATHLYTIYLDWLQVVLECMARCA
jgi:hypothetical protein